MSDKITVLYLVTACNNVGPVQQTLNIIKYLDRERICPILLTLYDEPINGSSQLKKFVELGVQHRHVPTSKKQIVFGRLSNLKKVLIDINPDVIHSLGVFPDYAVKKMNYCNRQMITLRNYMKEDYRSKFGLIKGKILEKLQMSAVKSARKVVTCSKSLAEIYKKRASLLFDYICNGIDTKRYYRVSAKEKENIRYELGLPLNKKIFVYSGQFVIRKNQRYLLEVFKTYHTQLDNCILLLLGDGPELEKLKKEYSSVTNIEFRGNVNNVNDFLHASDIYISSSRSEGMPNGVLEAMASGLPVILSDIPQHREIFESSSEIGELVKLDDLEDCYKKLLNILSKDLEDIGNVVEQCVKEHFSAAEMSKKYQTIYINIKNKG